MKKFKFPLQKVLNHRKTLLDLAQKDFMEAEAELRHQQQILSDMLDQERAAREKAGATVESGAPQAPEVLKQIHQFIVLQALRMERQRVTIQDVEKLVEEKREILRQKAVDLKIMEKLKEKRKFEFEREYKKKEQEDVDETNVLRFKSSSLG